LYKYSLWPRTTDNTAFTKLAKMNVVRTLRECPERYRTCPLRCPFGSENYRMQFRKVRFLRLVSLVIRGDSMQIKKSGLLIRKMKDCPNDFKQMVQWLNEPHVSEFYGTPLKLGEVMEKYLPRISMGVEKLYLV
jgi:hypothetical protein